MTHSNNCVASHCKYTVIIFISSHACAIALQDRVVVTGGMWSGNTVQVYTLSGPQEQLPDLQTPRHLHACAHYRDSRHRTVSIVSNITAHLTIVTIVTLHCVVMINNINVQVLLVTGGWNSGYLDSTELLSPYTRRWRYSAALPSPRRGLSGATLDNKVVITGTNSDNLVTTRLLIICVLLLMQFV